MDFNYQDIAPDGTAIFAKDNQLLVKFRVHSEQSQKKSKDAGIPIFDDVEIIEILTPGEKEPVIVQANEMHKRRFPKQYEAFKAGLQNHVAGTPLDMLFPESPSTVKQLKAFNIYSIQQLAAVTDSAISQIPMGRTLTEKAKAYLAKAGEGQNFHRTEALEKEVEQLKALLAERGVETQPVKRGPGRPRKTEQEIA